MDISKEIKQQLVLFVLRKAPVWLFNRAVREFTVQLLYSRYKNDLMREFPELMPSTLSYAIVMAESFKEYQCNEVLCPQLKYRIDKLAHEIKLARRYGSGPAIEKIREHNALVDEYTILLQPQNKLIKLYKKVIRDANKQGL